MGKRSKHCCKNEANADAHLQKTKRKQEVDEIADTSSNKNSKRKKSRKNEANCGTKRIITEDKPNKSESKTLSSQDSSNCALQDRGVKTNKKSCSDAGTIQKKIVFVDDVPQEVLVQKSVTNKGNNKKNQHDESEEIIDDRDIDNFCDGLSEQDNQQYEQWIQLLEAQLNPRNKNV